MSSTIRRLPDAELEVMQAIWACTPPVARTEIETILKQTHPMAQTTLLTLLTRNYGKLTAKARGLRRKNSPLIAPCQLLAYGEFTLF